MLRVAILFAAIICSARPLPRTLYQMISKNPGKGRGLLEPTPAASGDMRWNDAPVNEMKHWQDEWVRGHVPVILEYTGREDDSDDSVWEDSHEEALQRSDSKEAEDPSSGVEALNVGIDDGRSNASDDARMNGPDTDDDTSLEGETTNVVEEEASVEDLGLQRDDSENEVQGKDGFPVKLLLDKLLQQIAKSHPKQNVWNVMLSKLMGRETPQIQKSNEEARSMTNSDMPDRIEEPTVAEKQDEDSHVDEEQMEKKEEQDKIQANEEVAEEQPEQKEEPETKIQENEDVGEEQPEQKEEPETKLQANEEIREEQSEQKEEPETKLQANEEVREEQSEQKEEPETKIQANEEVAEDRPEQKEPETKIQANEEADDEIDEDCDCLDEDDEDSWVDDEKEEEYAKRIRKRNK